MVQQAIVLAAGAEACESRAQRMGVMRTGQVFVSHTSDMDEFPEGRSFVQAALDAVSRVGMAQVDMRYFAARDGKPADYCRERVRECEIYVAVIGFRYGSAVPGEAVSYTELEFDEASAAGLPRLVFLLDKPSGLPATLIDADRDAVEGFRQRLRSAGLIVRAFTSAATLELEVFHALRDVVDSVPSAGQGTAPPTLTVRYSLPPDAPAFTGRDDELGRITAGVTEAAGTGGVVAIHAIGGMPGVGKTALAVHVAHLLRNRFPDRQLFLNLHAHTPGQEPVTPEAALAGLLAVTGLDARYLPEDLERRTSLWRDRMVGQRALLVLDNAASSSQVIPLLPGDGGCLVLVTSRRHLGDLPGVTLPVLLDALPPDRAREMFLRLAPRAVTSPTAVQELVGLAGYLPLAISLLARMYAGHPSWTLADLTRETKTSLLTLAPEKDSIAAAFDVSYRYLPRDQQQCFRRLGLHPGTTIDAYSAAALADITLQEAAAALDALHGEGLLAETGYRRYAMHDLIRRYAMNLAAADSAADGDQALARLLDYYQLTAAAAEKLLTRHSRSRAASSSLTSPVATPELPDSMRALAWARVERGNLLACLDRASRVGQDARMVALTAGMAALLRLDGPWADAITRLAVAVQAARRVGDRPGEAGALENLAGIRSLSGDYPGASEALAEALGVYGSLGDRLGQASALINLGVVRRLTGDFPGASKALEEALGVYGSLGDRLGQASALSSLGVVRRQTGDYPGAAEALERALSSYRDLGDRLGQTRVLSDLGVVRIGISDYQGASAALEEALGISRDLGDRLGQGNALNFLGAVRRQTGDFPGASAAIEEALSIYRDLGDQRGQGNALSTLGNIRRLTGDLPGASAALEAALGIYRDNLSRAGVLCYLGAVRRQTGDFPGASAALEEALGTFRDLGDRAAEAETLNEVGTLNRVKGDLDQARACHQQALDLAREIGSSLDEAHALAGLGRCALAAGHTADAGANLRSAHQIFLQIGAAEAADVATEVDALYEIGTGAAKDPELPQ
jgi:tetratricopeptide (TPR) repeat protein